MLNPQIFQKHHQLVAAATTIIQGSAPESSTMKYFAQSWLDTLASKNGNDILESVLIEATGRSAKSISKKHGADSDDGELESKPFKTKYNAHISDDTPSSLLKHHTIPYICLGQASEDGRVILWAIETSYRIFDNSRYKELLQSLTPGQQAEFVEVLSINMEERYQTLLRLKQTLGPKKYIRSNALPLSDICSLKTGEFVLWLNPEVDSALIDKHIVKLNESQPNSTLSAEYMLPFLQMRDFCLKKSADEEMEKKAIKAMEQAEKKAIKAMAKVEKIKKT